MKLRSLTLVGFKSFKHRVTLGFGEGITAVVGPNGCGKSNLVDALFWVLGDQSPRHLRSTQMADVIFVGSHQEPQAGYAEVTIALDKAGWVIPQDYEDPDSSTLAVARRLYLDGESEYFINHKRARLKDIVDIFVDFGMSGNTYAIIEQGMITQMVENKPRDWSALIQSVAGLTKYKIKKEEAARKMELTREHCIRMDDIISELLQRKNALEGQVTIARKYKEYQTQLESLQREALALEVFICQQQIADVEKSTWTVVQELAGVQTEMNTLSAKSVQAQSELQEKVTALGSLDQTCQMLRQKRESLRLEHNTCFHTKERLELVIKQLEQDVQRMENQCQDIQNSRVHEDAKRSEIREALARWESEHQDMVRLYTRHLTDAEGVAQTLNQKRLEIQSVSDRIAKSVWETDQLSHQLTAHYQEMSHLWEENKQLATLMQTLRSQDVLQASTLEESRREHAQQQAHLDTYRLEMAHVTKELEDVSKHLMANRHEIQVLTLQIRHVMDLRRSQAMDMEKVPEGVASLVDTLTIPESHRNEIQCFLHAYQHVWTCATEDSVSGLVAALPTTRSKGILLTCAENKNEEDASSSIDSFLKGCDAVRVWDHFGDAALESHGIGRPMYEVSSLGKLLDLRRQCPPVLPCYVRSPERMVLLDHGWLYIPPTHVDPSGLFHLKDAQQELESQKIVLEDKVRTESAHMAALEERKKELEHTIQTTQAAIAELDRRASEAMVARRQLEVEMRYLMEKQKSVAAHGDTLHCEIVDQRRRLHMCQEERIKSEGKLLQHRSEIAHTEQHYDHLRAQALGLKAKYDAYEMLRTERNRTQEAIGSEIVRLDRLIQDHHDQMALLKANRTQYLEQHQKNAVQFTEAAENITQCEAEFQCMERSIADARQVVEQLRQTLELHTGELRLLEKKHATSEGKHLQLSTQLTSLKQALEDLGMGNVESPPEISQELKEISPTLQKKTLMRLRFEISETEKQMTEMGDVNLLALPQYEEVTERLSELQIQREDLVQSLINLESTISEIGQDVQKTFLETFGEVDRHFRKYFGMLFRGGEGYLSLSEMADNDGLRGVELHLAPPGKKIKQNTLLSGGEKALVALAFIMALFAVRPSPFLVLDEVDSPFDDTNTDAFVQLCRHLSETVQVIIITHNKKTMQAADTLYGVTLKSQGVSQVVSARLVATSVPMEMPRHSEAQDGRRIPS